MNNYDYLTDNDAWNDEEITEIDALNDIFNL